MGNMEQAYVVLKHVNMDKSIVEGCFNSLSVAERFVEETETDAIDEDWEIIPCIFYRTRYFIEEENNER